jgi:hypothetical protein
VQASWRRQEWISSVFLPAQGRNVDNLRHLCLAWNKYKLIAKSRYLKGFLAIAAQRETRDDAPEQQAAAKD